MIWVKSIAWIVFFSGFAVAQRMPGTSNQASKRDWEASVTLGNMVGVGTFVKGYSQAPAWSTALTLNPSYRVPEFWGLPKITLSAWQMISTWWLASYRTSLGDTQNKVAFSDLNLDASMSRIMEFQEVGFSFGAGLGIWLPVSAFSRNTGRIGALSASLPLRWSKWGVHAGWSPAVIGWLHGTDSVRMPCAQLPSGLINPQNAEMDIAQLAQAASLYRYGQDFGNGECLAVGRQIIAVLNNGFSMGWSNKKHSVGLSLNWFINFLRPLDQSKNIKGDYASDHQFTESTFSRLSYAYTIPIDDSNLILSAGLLTFQSPYTSTGNLAFPFFDFLTPGNNQTQVFVQATIAI